MTGAVLAPPAAVVALELALLADFYAGRPGKGAERRRIAFERRRLERGVDPARVRRGYAWIRSSAGTPPALTTYEEIAA